MFERFTERAILCIMFAQEESKRLKHTCVDAEHILLGVIGEGKGIAAQSLKASGVTLKAARITVKASMGIGKDVDRTPFFLRWMEPFREIPFSPSSKNILTLSLSESKKLGKNYLGTEHLLLGIIRAGENGPGPDSSEGALKVLHSLGVNMNDLERNIRERLN
jgi:ATP-dependent Clp protease ATP-binding subunit ClpA